MFAHNAIATLIFALSGVAEKDVPLVDASTFAADLIVDLRYATAANFLGRAVYPARATCLMLPVTAKKLRAAAESLKPFGLRLKVYDCYRPLSVQWKMWKLVPKPGYVADPRKGSNHNRGAAVDLTLAKTDGSELVMPTSFDTFSEASHQSYRGGSDVSRKNRDLLREKMVDAGFKPNPMEWWHFELPDAANYAVRDQPF